jgi:tetratricopeptide (TPR) repeat protein
MSERVLAELRDRYEAISEVLERAEQGDTDPREALRDQIVTLFRDTESLIERLSGFREEIRPLAERYRAAFPKPTAPEPPPAAAVRIDHLGASTYLERGWSAIAGANYELAVREIGRALQLAPGTSRGEVLLAWAYMRLGQITEARSLLEGVLDREPENQLARANLGYVCLRESRFAEAIEHLATAQRARTDRTAELYAHLYMGMVYTEREMYRDARSLLNRSLELGPNLIEAYWELGRAWYAEGKMEEALEAWTAGARRNRFNPWGERCEEAAARLREGGTVSLA